MEKLLIGGKVTFIIKIYFKMIHLIILLLIVRMKNYRSLGTLLFEMLTGEAPFKAREKNKLYKKILTQKIVLPKFLSAECVSLLKGILTKKNIFNP